MGRKLFKVLLCCLDQNTGEKLVTVSGSTTVLDNRPVPSHTSFSSSFSHNTRERSPRLTCGCFSILFKRSILHYGYHLILLFPNLSFSAPTSYTCFCVTFHFFLPFLVFSICPSHPSLSLFPSLFSPLFFLLLLDLFLLSFTNTQ